MKEYIIPIPKPINELQFVIYDKIPERYTELIRCKDCKYWSTYGGMFKDIDERQWHHCPHIGIDTEEYFFCSEAERKEE